MVKRIKEALRRDRKGHFISQDSDFTICPTCLKNDWMNYYVDLT